MAPVTAITFLASGTSWPLRSPAIADFGVRHDERHYYAAQLKTKKRSSTRTAVDARLDPTSIVRSITATISLMTAVQLFANEHAETMRENQRLSGENQRLRREIEQLRARLASTATSPRPATATTAVAVPFVARLSVGGPTPVIAAAPATRLPQDVRAQISAAAPEPAAPAISDDAALRFKLLELD
jgi:hypothetical protein